MAKTKSRVLSLVLVFFVAFAAMWTFNLDTSYAAVKKIHLKKTTITLVKGKTYQQKLLDKRGKVISATKVKWKSLKTSVAKISKKGKVTAVKAGTAKMTAKYKGKTYKFTVKVKPNNDYIAVDQPSITIGVGEVKTLIVYTDKGEDLSSKASNGNVDFWYEEDWFDNGTDTYFYVQGLKPGTSTVTVYDANKTTVKATIRVTVTSEPKDLTSLYNYIEDKGVIDDDGNSYIVGEGTADDFAVITNTGSKTMEFAYVLPDKLFVTMSLVLPKTTTANPVVMVEVSNGVMLGETTMNVATYNSDSTLYFSDAGGDLTVNQNLCNSGLKLAMATFELVLSNNGYSLNDLGFINY